MQHNMSEGIIKHVNDLFLGKKTARTGVLLQLFLTHALSGGIALALVFGLTHLKISLEMSVIAAIVVSGSFGLLLTTNIQHTVHLIERAVIAISQGRPAYMSMASMPTFSWPLTQLFTYLRTLDQRVQTYIQNEQAATKIRQQYLQQASETATRTERQRIARDLHDSIKQQLFSVSVSAAAVNAYLSKDIAKARVAITDIQRVAKEAQVEMQALLQQLGATPLENTKLADALRTQAEALKYRSGLEMELTIGDLPADELLPEGTHETIFRLVQEAFANIARHARAKAVTVTLQQTEQALHLIVSDNGKGFDTNMGRAGMGLTNMRERVAALNGTIEVQSALEQGTTVHIAIPFMQIQSPIAENTWSEHELSEGKERAVNGFQIGYTAQSIAMFFITSNMTNFFIQIPIVAIGMCMLIAGYGFWQGHSWKTRLTSHWGKESMDMLKLQQREEKMLVGLLCTLAFGGFYILKLQNVWDNIYAITLFIVIFVLFFVLLFILLRKGYYTQGRVYRAMPPSEIQAEIKHQRRKMTRYMRILVSVVLSGMLLGGGFVTSLTGHTAVSNSIVFIPLLLIGGGGVVLGEFFVLKQQLRALEGEAQKVSLLSILKGE